VTIAKYVAEHTERGECKCGRCADVGNKSDPTGPHTVDMMFFLVAKAGCPTAEEFARLTKEHRSEFSECNPFDGKEHGFIELGSWIGDQGAALLYMALGSLLGIFDLLTPRTVLPGLDEATAMELAGGGLVTVKKRSVS
jgi:hypothetical protein